jgi:hypothetical protein
MHVDAALVHVGDLQLGIKKLAKVGARGRLLLAEARDGVAAGADRGSSSSSMWVWKSITNGTSACFIVVFSLSSGRDGPSFRSNHATGCAHSRASG